MLNACMGLVKERILFFKFFQVDLNTGWHVNTNRHPTVPAIQAALDCAGGSTNAAARRAAQAKPLKKTDKVTGWVASMVLARSVTKVGNAIIPNAIGSALATNPEKKPGL